MDSFTPSEPDREDLAAIVDEWPVIAAELEVTDAECRLAGAPDDVLAVRAHRVRRPPSVCCPSRPSRRAVRPERGGVLMLTVPLFLLLAALTAVLVKTRSVSPGPVVLGVALGLTLASTAVGPPVIEAITSATASAGQTMTASMGGTK